MVGRKELPDTQGSDRTVGCQGWISLNNKLTTYLLRVQETAMKGSEMCHTLEQPSRQTPAAHKYSAPGGPGWETELGRWRLSFVDPGCRTWFMPLTWRLKFSAGSYIYGKFVNLWRRLLAKGL